MKSQHPSFSSLVRASSACAVALVCAAMPGTASAAGPAPAAQSSATPQSGTPWTGYRRVGGSPTGEFGATVRRTRNGVAHIDARDEASLGYGVGYAFAEDNLCTIADSYVTVAGDRSKFFGADKTWYFSGNSQTVPNLDADAYYRWINARGFVEKLADEAPPRGPLPEVKALVTGYVAGYNDYLDDVGGADGLPDPRCRGAEWVRPITTTDVYRRFYQLASLASGGVAIPGITNAAPTVDPAPARDSAQQRDLALELKRRLQAGGIGSNAIGLGGDATDDGLGMMLGNPHFPWHGAERLWQVHLRIPGKMDVSGSALYGVPLVLIGHTRGLAWSHTVATAYRFTPYEEKLNPTNPRQYFLDGQIKDMLATTVEVPGEERPRRQADDPRDRSRPGPHVAPRPAAVPVEPGDRLLPGGFQRHELPLPQPLLRERPRPVRPRVPRDPGALPGDPVGQLAGRGPQGRELLLDERRDAGRHRRARAALQRRARGGDVRVDRAAGARRLTRCLRLGGLPEGRGTRDPGQRQDPVPVPARLRRERQRLALDDQSGAAPRGLRPHHRHRAHGAHAADPARRPDHPGPPRREGRQARQPLHASADLENSITGNRQYLGELWRDELVALCRANPTMDGVDVSKACDVLAAWNLTDELDAPGALLFRRFAARAFPATQSLPAGTQGSNEFGVRAFRVPFDPADPVNTPRGLADTPLVRSALATRSRMFRRRACRSTPPCASRSRRRPADRDGRDPWRTRAGLACSTPSPPRGSRARAIPDVIHGSSFVMVADFEAKGCPARSETFLTYGQSENPSSPHRTDQLHSFSEEQWNRPPYCRRDVLAAPEQRVEVLGNACPARAGVGSVAVTVSRSRGALLRVRPRPGSEHVRYVVQRVAAGSGRVLATIARGRLKAGGGTVRVPADRRRRTEDLVVTFTRDSPSGSHKRRIALLVRNGVLRRGPRFAAAPSCGAVRDVRLAAPRLGGASTLRWNIDRAARVRVEVLRGKRVVRRYGLRRTVGDRTQSLRVRGRGLPRGALKVRVVATLASGTKVSKTLTTRR